MTKQVINTGTAPNDGTGDNARVSFTKTNANFDELYAAIGGGVIPLAQKGIAGGVAALNANGNLTYRQEGVALPSYRVATQASGSTGYRYATSGDLASLKHNANEATTILGQFKTARPSTGGTMLSLEFAGQRLGAVATLNCTVQLYITTALSVGNCWVNHRGDWRPAVLAGVNSTGELCIVFDTTGTGTAGFFLISLMAARIGHVGADVGFRWMSTWSTAVIPDLTSFTTAPLPLADTGPLPLTGGALTGPLILASGLPTAVALGLGGRTDTGLSFSGSSSQGVQVSSGGTGVASFLGSALRLSVPLGFSSAITVAPDVTLTRTGANALVVGASAVTSFTGSVNVGNNLILEAGSNQARISKVGSAAGVIDMNPAAGDGTSDALLRVFQGAAGNGLKAFQILNGSGSSSAARHELAVSGAEARAGIGGASSAGRTLRVYGDTQIDGGLFAAVRTSTTLPAASSNTGATFYCSNAQGGASECTSDGTDWISHKTGLPVSMAPYETGPIGVSGEYGNWFVRRYADGTMVCTLRFILVLGGGLTADTGVNLAATPMSWPAAFTSIDTLHPSFSGGWAGYVDLSCGNSGPSTASTGLCYLKNISNGNTGAIDGKGYLTAVGRWKN
ncbi:hypothetical protein [Bordetella genomosp. 13]|uniref:hypothetical protein n=1 Tax=Bordetella genomosp. 13 TaxID=463040 RepID=UPI0011A51841|nr:hypothetical protein [Bordetella genomosp. 13]